MAQPQLYALIMAGGRGQRLWPLSRETRPKQALTLHGERSLFRLAVDRLLPLVPPERILVVTVSDYVDLLHDHAPELARENFIVEPAQRGTAPCIGLAALDLVRRDPGAVMAVVTADHLIRDVERLQAVLGAAAQVAGQGRLVTLGIRPTDASTGLGYIERGAPLDTVAGFPVYEVSRFIEKPPAAEAERMVADARYSWNSGMFVWRAETILQAFAEHMPDFHERLEALAPLLGRPDDAGRLARLWSEVETQTIDYGVMERARNVAVIPVDLGWSDVGSWGVLLDVLPHDEQGNVVFGEHLGVDTRRTLVHGGAGRLIATFGLENMVIVDTEDVLLVCPADRAQDVRELVRRLEAQGRTDLL